ncbi:MAG: tetratricopeptide repeat protein [Candidatus Promineifilaceae bacterium]|nr:tetratricopeptide repeat protein [Candidatus Promineifilaceae bacterium]
MTTEEFPFQPTPLIGRQKEIADITDSLTNPACRLLTVVGPGGIGKTRLAVEAAAQTGDDFSDDAHFVDLHSVGASAFQAAIADTFSLSLSGREEPQVQLLNYLRKKEVLLVLDNFEHLLSQATFLAEMLRQAPGVNLLVTSREALNLREEWLYPVSGLAFPDNGAEGELADYGAVRLFLERARRVRPDFSLADKRSSIVRICRLVEGMPLALELAASWSKSLTCDVIADEIQRNIDFLSSNLRDIPERHRSMKAVFEHSWRLLGEEERRVFERLSLFHGGFRRAAAEQVAEATLPILSALVDKCLLKRNADGRYYIHELLRQYGATKLKQDPAAAARSEGRHATYYADFLYGRVSDINGSRQQQAAAEIAAEIENVRAAWQWAVTNGDVDTILRCASTFFYFCQMESRFLEGAKALAQAARVLEELPPGKRRDVTLAAVLNHEGWLRIRVGDLRRAEAILVKSRHLFDRHDETLRPYMGWDSAVPLGIVRVIEGNHEEAIALGEEAQRKAAAQGDAINESFAHYLLTTAKSAQGNYEAAYRHAQRACSLARQAGNRWFLAYPLNEWGNVARAMGNYAEAKKHFEGSYALKKEMDDAEGMAVALNHLGEIAVLQSNYGEAKELFGESRAIYNELNDWGGRAASLRGLGQVALERRAYEEARAHFQQALEMAAEIRFWPLVFGLLIDGANLLMQVGQPQTGLALLATVKHQPASEEETKARAGRELNRWRTRVDDDVFDKGTARGRELDLETAVTTLQTALAAPIKLDEPRAEQDQPLPEPLTDRELEVLQLMTQGYTNPEIAEELVIAIGTVKWYASQIYGKLSVNNRTEAAHRARELGLLS